MVIRSQTVGHSIITPMLVRCLGITSCVSPTLFRSWDVPPHCHPGGPANNRDFCSAFPPFSEMGSEDVSCLSGSLYCNRLAGHCNCIKPRSISHWLYEIVSKDSYPKWDWDDEFMISFKGSSFLLFFSFRIRNLCIPIYSSASVKWKKQGSCFAVTETLATVFSHIRA